MIADLYEMWLNHAIFAKEKRAMPEITIKYSNSKTLKVLKALSEYLDFSVAKPGKKGKEELIYINGVPVIPGDKSIDISDMGEIISRNNM